MSPSTSIQATTLDTDSDIGSSDSDGDDGWETTEEVDGDAGHDDH